MNHEQSVALIDRVLAHVHARTTDTGPAGGVDRTTYTDPNHYAAELRMFARTPLIVGHDTHVAEPGQYITREVAGVPIVVVHGKDGVVRGFKNVCRHRGARVVTDAAGCARSLTCPYHRWTYGLDGRLVGVPHGDGFPQVEAGGPGLSPVATTVHAGFVWVTLDGAGGCDAAAHVGALGDDFVDEQLPTHVVHDPRRFEHAMNWKLAIDVFLEAYHLKTAHERSIYPIFFDNLGLVDAFEPHLRNVFPKRTIADLRGTDPATWRLRDHANVLYVIFPNTLVLMEPDHASILHIYPDGIDRCVLDTYTLVPEPPTTDRARAYWAANNDILYGAIAEDLALGESIQSGFAAAAHDRLTFGTFEHALTFFHGWIAARVDHA